MNYGIDYKREFIEFMARAGVLTFGDFVTKSGRNTSYFINTGNYETGAQIKRLGEFYKSCIMANVRAKKIPEDIKVMFGPAYKGIPLAVSTAIALSEQGINAEYCFNRKEEKDHGDGGTIVGHKLQDGEKVLIIEDVITAGTAVRETLPILKSAADVEIVGLVVSVDRMERGQGEKTAIQEIYEEFGIRTFPIVTVRDIIRVLYDNPLDGKIIIDDEMKAKMEAAIVSE